MAGNPLGAHAAGSVRLFRGKRLSAAKEVATSVGVGALGALLLAAGLSGNVSPLLVGLGGLLLACVAWMVVGLVRKGPRTPITFVGGGQVGQLLVHADHALWNVEECDPQKFSSLRGMAGGPVYGAELAVPEVLTDGTIVVCLHTRFGGGTTPTAVKFAVAPGDFETASTYQGLRAALGLDGGSQSGAS
jgi:hypothetical protein